MYFLKLIIVFSYIAGSSSVSPEGFGNSGSLVSVQSYRKIDIPLNVWNLFSSRETEEVTILSDTNSSGIIQCGVACQKNSKCGGFLYDKASRSCSMKLVKNDIYILECEALSS